MIRVEEKEELVKQMKEYHVRLIIWFSEGSLSIIWRSSVFRERKSGWWWWWWGKCEQIVTITIKRTCLEKKGDVLDDKQRNNIINRTKGELKQPGTIYIAKEDEDDDEEEGRWARTL